MTDRRHGLVRLIAALAVGVALLAGLGAPDAQARALELHELHEMELYLNCAFVTCEDDCRTMRDDLANASYDDVVGCETCLTDQACGDPPRLWEKDGVPPVSMRDHELAVLEQLDPSSICYADADETIVRPKALCPGQACIAVLSDCLSDDAPSCSAVEPIIDCQDEDFGETCWYQQLPVQGCPSFVCDASDEERADLLDTVGAMCADTDGNGLPAWATDTLVGATLVDCTSDSDCVDGLVCSAYGAPDRLVCQRPLCDLDNPCGFLEVCTWDTDDQLPTCVSRTECTDAGAASGPTDDDESSDRPACDSDTGACLECVYHTHCEIGSRCAANECVTADRCDSSLDCSGGQVCDTSISYCVDCVSDAECADGTTCSDAGFCVTSCDSDLDCTDSQLLCDADRGHCVGCVTDDVCGFDSVCVSGVCRANQCSDDDVCVLAPDEEDPAEAACEQFDCHAQSTLSHPGCTAFHLEEVAQDDLEVLVHVHYDFTPVPARVLDLFIEYDDAQLTLQDARPLPGLTLNGKELASTHLSDGTLNLSVFDKDETHAISTGPIIELVFQRIGPCATRIAFTDRADLRVDAVAPKQGSQDVQDELADPALWGDPVLLCARSEAPTKTRLWYGFETADDPLAYSDVQTADELCARMPECVNEDDEEVKARLVARLEELQRGELLADESIGGVTREAIYFDGGSDHLRLPVHYRAPTTTSDTSFPLEAEKQSFSMSTWYYTEGNSPDELGETPQLLFSHNAYNERTGLGLISVDKGNGNTGLAFFFGDVLDPRLSGEQLLTETQELPSGECAVIDPLEDAPAFWVAPDVAVLTWHHVAFTLNAAYDQSVDDGNGGVSNDNSLIELYFDGARVGCAVVLQPPNAVQCPQFAKGTDVVLHDEGDVLGGRSPEYVYLAVRRSNLYGIERMDPGGLQSTEVIGDTEFNYRDPDYSPILDRIVYASDASGSWEIWIANGDGSNRRMITEGFGDSFRGFSARRPRWAPDGSAIIFDSNAFDVLAKDNTFARTRHLYFIGYDNLANEVAVELVDGSTTDVLSYDDRLADQTITDYRLTSAVDRHHRNARWLTGEDPDQPNRARGALVFDSSKSDFSGHRVYLLTIPTATSLASTEQVPGLGSADEIKLIDAFHKETAAFPEPITTELALVQREDLLWETDDQFVAMCDDGAGTQVVCGPGHDQSLITVEHVPSGYVDNCWDANFDGVANGSEDTNGDGVWDTTDCYPVSADVYLSYNLDKYVPVLDLVERCTGDRDCDGGFVCRPTPPSGTQYAFEARCEIADRSSTKSCSSSDDCPDQTFCDTDGLCKGLVGTVLGCALDSDCFTGQICDYGKCKAPGGDPRLCLEDSDCPANGLCVDGSCRVTPKECASVEQCDAGNACSGTKCECVSDAGCPTGYTCSGSGRCETPATGYTALFFFVDDACTSVGDAGCPSGTTCDAVFGSTCRKAQDSCIEVGGCPFSQTCGTDDLCQCADSAQCDTGQSCNNGLCVQVAALECADTDECSDTETCDGGECRALGWASTVDVDTDGDGTHDALGLELSHVQPCVLDIDCDGGQICSGNECVVITVAKDCSTDADCDGGEVCGVDLITLDDGSESTTCRPAGDFEAPAVPKNTECTTDDDCGTGEGCWSGDGSCQTVCESDDGCAGGEMCDVSAALCKPVVGEVVLSELGTALTFDDAGETKIIFGKEVKLTTRFAFVNGVSTALVRVQVTSPQSAAPLSAGPLAHIRFEEIAQAAPTFTPEIYRQRTHIEVVVKDLTTPALPDIFEPAGTFDLIEDGAFSPDGDRILLAAISNARPILLRTDGLTSAVDADRVIVNPIAVGGVRWVRQARYYPCNWAGGYLHLQSKSVLFGFRGGLDDLKVHEGLRDPDALRSEAERGFEFLAQNDSEGEVESLLPNCGNSHVECPAFHLCIESECQMVPCDPDDPWSCSEVGGRCTLRPESVEQENIGADGSNSIWDWVCAADCNTDNQCFTEACLNGPCRFCEDATKTCIECRDSVQQLGAIQIAGIEGCPDQRSFECVAGACLTDCYAFEDGESIYLCDETTEYCDRGKCVLLDWDWWDLAPATFAGLGETRLTVAPNAVEGWGGYTAAVDQTVPIEVVAYGVEDWGLSPELVVEVTGGPFYGDSWQRVGKITVHHRTKIDAQNAPYRINATRMFEDMRLRLVTDATHDVTGAATGLRANDKDFCIRKYLTEVANDPEAAGKACSHLAQGSRYTVGYASSVTTAMAIEDCAAKGHLGCPVTSDGEFDFLQPGQPAVVVLDLQVDGGGAMNNITSNTVCRYDGDFPVDGGAASKLIYGRFGDEISNQADALRASCAPSLVPDDFTGLWTGDGTSAVSVGAGQSDPGDGVNNSVVATVDGLVGQAFEFDFRNDYLGLPTGIVAGKGEFSFETWVRTGDSSGGLVTIFARPRSCADWKERGRTTDGSYAIWPKGIRPIPVYCEGMSDPEAEAIEFIELVADSSPEGDTNVARYAAGGGSFGTPVVTSYDKLRFDPETFAVDIADQTFASDNGGRVGHGCGAAADPSDAASLGCFLEDGGLRHLLRGEYSIADSVQPSNERSYGVTYEPGRVGQALAFDDATGGRVVLHSAIPSDSKQLTVEAWIRTTEIATQVIARQGTDLESGAWELAVEAGMLRFTVFGGEAHDGADTVLYSPTGLPTLSDGEWHHVAATLDGFSDDVFVKLYVDGAMVVVKPDLNDADDGFWTLPELANESLIVVGQGRHGADAFKGALDDVGIWSTPLDEDAIDRLYTLGAWGVGTQGAGFGKCLPEEVTGLAPCVDTDDFVTTLPLGVAYGCLGGDSLTTARLDLRGTPFALDETIDAPFTKVGTGIPVGTADVTEGGQLVTLRGGGDCGGIAPTKWSGDPTTTPPASNYAIKLRVLDDVTATPSDCQDDHDCVGRMADELLAVSLNAGGLTLHIADRAYEIEGAPDKRIDDLTWRHLAVVRDSDALHVYLDGETWLSTTDVPFLSDDASETVDRIIIGQDTTCAFAPDSCDDRSAAFRGRLDEIALYDRALTQAEVVTVVDAGRRGRPVDGRPLPECPDDEEGLVEFNRALYGHALLNCNFYDSDPTGESAAITLKNVIVQRLLPAEKGAIVFDDGDSCLIEQTSVLNVPCYEWYGADVTLDGGNDLIDFGSYVPFQGLEVSLPRSFGFDEGYDSLPQPSYNVTVVATSLAGGAELTIDAVPSPTGEPITFPGGNLPLGSLSKDRRFNVVVTDQPDGYRCSFFSEADLVGVTNDGDTDSSCGTCVSGVMPESAIEIPIECLELRSVTLAYSFADDEGNLATSPQLLSDLVVLTSVTSSSAEPTSQLTRFGPTGTALSGSTFEAPLTSLQAVDGDTVTVALQQGPIGWSCEVSPEATTVAADVTVMVACQAASEFPLKVEVAGLSEATDTYSCDGTGSSQGVKVTATKTADGTTATVCAGGDGTFEFPTLTFLAGETWQIEIGDQPTGTPVRSCALTANSAGEMSASGIDANILPTVTCSEPDNVVYGQFVGLYSDAELTLVKVEDDGSLTDMQVLTVPAEDYGFTPLPVAFTFPDPVPDGYTIRVTVSQAPEGLDCTVAPEEISTPLSEGVQFVVNCTEPPPPTYKVSGTVSGLSGDQLRLSLASGAELLDIPAGATTFAFALAAEDKTDYEVAIDRQPEGQYCTLSDNATGTFSGAHVDDVHVTCQHLTVVSVDIQAPSAFEGAAIRAYLVRRGGDGALAGYLDGTGDGALTISNQSATIEFVGVAPADTLADVPTGPAEDGEPTVFGPIVSGDYALYVMLSESVSEATGEVYFPAGPETKGAWHEFSIVGQPETYSIDLSVSQFKNTVTGQVTMVIVEDLADLDKNSEIQCAWSPLGTVPRPPFEDEAPLIGLSSWQCQSNEGCVVDVGVPYVTFIHDALPPDADMTVTCWGDTNNNGTNGGALSVGDIHGVFGVDAGDASAGIAVPVFGFDE